MGINDRVAERRSELEAQAVSRADKLREEFALNLNRALELRKNRRELLDLASRVAISLSSSEIPTDIELVKRVVEYKRRHGRFGKLEARQQVESIAKGWLLRKNDTEKGIPPIFSTPGYLNTDMKSGAVLTPDGLIKAIHIPTMDSTPLGFAGITGEVIVVPEFTDFPSLDQTRSHLHAEPTQLSADVYDYPGVQGDIFGVYENLDLDSDTEYVSLQYLHIILGGSDFKDREEHISRADTSLIDGLITLAAIHNVTI